MKTAWPQAPCLRLFIPFAAGIFVQYQFQCGYMPGLALLLLAAGIFCLFRFIPVARRYPLEWVRGVGVQLLIISLGICSAWLHNQRNHSNWYGHITGKDLTYIGRVSEPITARAKTYKVALQITAVQTAKGTQPTSGQVWAYVAKDSNAAQLRYGDLIAFRQQPEPIQNSGNPETFDYARYAALQNIFQSVYLKNDAWRSIGKNTAYTLPAWIYKLSTGCLIALQQTIPDRTTMGVAEALLIGYRNDLDQQLVRQYTNAGIIHIIAISGLHMGVVYFLILWLLSWLPERRFRYVKYPVAILCMWVFTFMTGAPASVVRSAVMFTCIALGKMWGKKNYSLNFLFASACLLLWYNPYWLFDIGFQLSYLAILSIFIFYQPLYRKVYVPWKWLNHIWQLVSCTLAAQILTLPITLYYFHQFPLGFIISNLVAIPASTLILYVEIALVLCFPISATIAGWLGWLTHWGITGMNWFVARVDALQLHITNIHISLAQYLLLFATIVALYYWVKFRQFKPALAAGLCLLAFTFESFRLSYQATKVRRLIIYNITKTSAVARENGSAAQLSIHPLLSDTSKDFQFNIQPGHIVTRKKQIVIKDSFPAFEVVGHKTIAYIDSSFRLPDQVIKVDYVVLRNNTRCPIEKIINHLQPGLIVFDSSNSAYCIKKWKKACERLTLRHFSVPDEGALVLNF